ncbi:mechanosensitive ion channel protein MscL [Hydrococcus rivularis NIES-593]|uniref:Large-conductance mechanosensitive channel n=1 Tax=Hydrococcus rivularis NIES-593 TaxID=1921803 RepID=A0A1U7HIZ7_9CYAN|nr:large conductance mechanosensitive channel protein MscL [Hydrococcus rivularis]OKH23562.1 mechanosensitive ion channel protein MscL [Hydrococcus rivularis NIES-593]
MARRRRVSGFMRDFQEFALKGNVVELAIAVIIGGAFGKIITSFVEDIIMPLINPLVSMAGADWRTITIPPGIAIGKFLGAVVDFIIITFVLFLAIRAITRFKRQEEVAAQEEPVLDPALQSQERLTSAIERLTKTIESQGG